MLSVPGSCYKYNFNLLFICVLRNIIEMFFFLNVIVWLYAGISPSTYKLYNIAIKHLLD